MYYLCTMYIGLWPAAPRNLKKWPMANFEWKPLIYSNKILTQENQLCWI